MEFVLRIGFWMLVFGYISIGGYQLFDFLLKLIRISSYELISIKRKIKLHGLYLAIYFFGLWLQLDLDFTKFIALYIFIIPWIFVINWIQIRKKLGYRITTEGIIEDFLKA